MLYNLAQVALARGDHELATRMLEEGVTLSEQIGDPANLSYFLEGLAVVAGIRGESEYSARLLGAAEGLREEAGPSIATISPTVHSTTVPRPTYVRGWAKKASRMPRSRAEP